MQGKTSWKSPHHEQNPHFHHDHRCMAEASGTLGCSERELAPTNRQLASILSVLVGSDCTGNVDSIGGVSRRGVKREDTCGGEGEAELESHSTLVALDGRALVRVFSSHRDFTSVTSNAAASVDTSQSQARGGAAEKTNNSHSLMAFRGGADVNQKGRILGLRLAELLQPGFTSRVRSYSTSTTATGSKPTNSPRRVRSMVVDPRGGLEYELDEQRAWTRSTTTSAEVHAVDTVTVAPDSATIIMEEMYSGFVPSGHSRALGKSEQRRSHPPSPVEFAFPTQVVDKKFDSHHCPDDSGVSENDDVQAAELAKSMSLEALKGAYRSRSMAYDEPKPLGGVIGSDEEKTGVSIVREQEIRHTLGRLAPRLLQSEERVKYLEGQLIKRTREHDDHTASLKQVNKLDREVEGLRKCLQERRVEALGLQDIRQVLEARNHSLAVELHHEIGRTAKVEATNRHTSAQLDEAQKITHDLKDENTSLLAELKRRDQTSTASEKKRRETLHTAHTSAKTAKASARRAAAATNEGAIPHGEIIRRGKDTVHDEVVLEGQRRRSSLLSNTEDTAGVAATRSDDNVGRGATRYAWPRPTESDMRTTARIEQDQKRHTSLSSDEGFPVEVGEPIADGNPLGGPTVRRSEHESRGKNPFYRPRAVSTIDNIAETRCCSPRLGDELWRENKREPCDAHRIDEVSAKGARSVARHDAVHAASDTREKVRARRILADKQRYDSDGVRGALTVVTPDWGNCTSRGASHVKKSREYGGCAREPWVRPNINNNHMPQAEVDAREKYTRDQNANVSRSIEVCTGEDDCQSSDSAHRSRVADRSRSEAELSLVEYPASSPTPVAAGQRRGRDFMSSRRSSLCGAGVGVKSENGQVLAPLPNDNSHPHKSLTPVEGQHISLEQGPGTPGTAKDATSPAQEPKPTSHDAYASRGGFSRSCREQESGRRSTLDGNSEWTKSSLSVTRSNGNATSSAAPATCEKQARRERSSSAPFATGAVEDELRPQLEMERRLTILQMEISQVQGLQNKLLPKATKTMEARNRMQRLQNRLEWLEKESSGLRRVLRDKSWPT